ncbi:MAG TPA: adenylate/guanylate cyclase domain-containing protein [Opitutaceae bacterium]|nr:adenylate/guanylate cyclase domain-containing protein [Opitutaceae bacterium]
MPFFRFRRFSRQLIFLWVGLLAILQLIVFWLIAGANERSARLHIRENLQTGARVFQRVLDERVESLRTSAALLSGDYAIKPLLMREPDEATLRSILASYTERVKAPMIGLFDSEGALLALAGENLPRGPSSAFQSLITRAASAEEEHASGYVQWENRLFIAVAVPLYAPFPHIAAWFVLAYPIDAPFAKSIQELTQLEVSFVSLRVQGSGQILSTTLTPSAANHLGLALRDIMTPLPAETTLMLGSEPFITHRVTLPLIEGEDSQVILQRSLNAELAPARRLERIIAVIAFVSLVIASLVASALAGSISEPLRALARHTEHVAKGDYTQKVVLDRKDELGQLADSFNVMTTGLAERDRVQGLLGKVVSPEIASQLLKSDLALGGEEREVTVLFCDLCGFSSLSERLGPTDLLRLLNRYLDRMATIIERNGGVIDKYIGDAIMALYGAPVTSPHGASLALLTAREMVDALDQLNHELRAEGSPTLAFGIGINTARVIAGNMGSRSRLNYTVIGDGVNLAARLQALTRDPRYATPILFSEGTYHSAQPRPHARDLGEVTVKGKAQAVKIYALSLPAPTSSHLPPGP